MSSSPSQSSSALSLSGDTPVPSPPSSDAGDSCSTRVCSRAPSFELKREDKKTQDIQDDGSNEKTIAPERDDKEAWTIEEGRVLPPVEPELKEGGVRGYCAVAGAVLLLVSTFGLSNSFGVFLAQYKLMLPDYPSSTLSWIGSTHLALTFGSSLLSGYLFDKGLYVEPFRFHCHRSAPHTDNSHLPPASSTSSSSAPPPGSSACSVSPSPRPTSNSSSRTESSWVSPSARASDLVSPFAQPTLSRNVHSLLVVLRLERDWERPSCRSCSRTCSPRLASLRLFEPVSR